MSPDELIVWALDRKLVTPWELQKMSVVASVKMRISDYIESRKQETNNDY